MRAGRCFSAVRYLPRLLFRDRMVDLGFGLTHTLVSFGVWGAGAGKQLVGAVYAAGAERLPGLPVHLGGQVPPLAVAGALRQVLTVGQNVPGGDRPAILGALVGGLTGLLGLPGPRPAARRQGFEAGGLGFGVGPADLGVTGRSAGGLACLSVTPGGWASSRRQNSSKR